MIAETYGIDWDVTEYVDLTLSTDIVIPSATGMYDIPKKSKKRGGEVKDQPIRRQNISISPLIIYHTELKTVPTGTSTEEAPDLSAPEPVVFEEKASAPVEEVKVAEVQPEVQPEVDATPETPIGIPEDAVPTTNTNPLFNTPAVAPKTASDAPDWAKGLGSM